MPCAMYWFKAIDVDKVRLGSGSRPIRAAVPASFHCAPEVQKFSSGRDVALARRLLDGMRALMFAGDCYARCTSKPVKPPGFKS